MSWVDFAILSTAALGVVNILDSHILTRRLGNLRIYLLLAALFHGFYGLVVLWLFPLPAGVGAGVLLVALASGLLRAVSITITLYVMLSEDVAQVIPVVFVYPVFVALMAVPLLGESLQYLEWLAIFIVVSGAVLVSARQSPTGSVRLLGRTFLLLLGVSLLIASADLTSKYALGSLSSWNLYSLTEIVFAAFFLAFSARRRVFRELASMQITRSTWGLIAFTETLAPLAMALFFRAMESGPVSLVSTVMGSRPIFVLLYSMVLSRVFPRFLIWSASRRLLLLRLVATIMIVGGISIIYLN